MATHLGSFTRATPRASSFRAKHNHLPLAFAVKPRIRSWKLRASDGANSYLDMWKNAVDRGRKAIEFQKIAENTAVVDTNDGIVEDLEKKSEEFEKILEVSKEERDRIQRMQVIDRAAAAISAARAALKENVAKPEGASASASASAQPEDPKRPLLGRNNEDRQGTQNGSIFVPGSENSTKETPGPDFWSWTPPADSDTSIDDFSKLQTARAGPAFPPPTKPVVEKERSKQVLPIPFESKLIDSDHNPPLPPLQSLLEVEKVEVSESTTEIPSFKEEHEHAVEFSAHAAEAAQALGMVEESLPCGVHPDGSRWWKETGIEQRPDGVICKWTVRRGVSADQAVEWQEKYWEASDEFGYKELGSEKSGRDATGSVWREFWRESMRQESGLVHLEKTADKWGKNGNGDQWQEQWWEHYNSSGQADKWAHKWCSIDPTTPLDAGHAHVWHERWGEEYDGQGGSIKYTDKWAERCEDGGWTKWGDKWDENFDPNGHGVKQGETWWEGKHGERWNRTWGEGHNGSGWVHKYGKSSSGEHWDTHEPQETWYERFPHFGFYHCYDNSVQLREVPKPSDM